MTRFTNSANETAAAQSHVDYAFLVTLDFASGTQRVFNGFGQISFDGNTYSGLGEFGSIEEIGESTDLRPANPIRLVLSGTDLPNVASVLDRSEWYGRSVEIHVAMFDSRLQLITPVEGALWEGFMDHVALIRNAPESTIVVTCENRMTLFDRSIGLLNSDEHQQLIFPGDLFYDQIAFQKNKQVNWGGGRVVTGTGGGGGGGGGGRGETQER